MSALAFWKAVVQDESNFLERVIGLLDGGGFRYCVIGGVGVNAYVEPVLTLDLDIVLAVEQLEDARVLLGREFKLREFEHSINVYDPGSKLQVQIPKDPGLSEIIERSETRSVLDLRLPVASAPDLIHLKAAAAMEPERRASKRQKDLADISRLLEAFPELRSRVPQTLLDRLF